VSENVTKGISRYFPIDYIVYKTDLEYRGITGTVLTALLLLLTLFQAPVCVDEADAASTWSQAGSSDFANGTFNSTAPGGAGGVTLNRTINGNWTRVTTSPSPSARAYHGMATIFSDDRVLAFGGWDGMTHLGDTWVLDLKNRTWTDVSAGSSQWPDARDDFVMSGIPGTDIVVLFGGESFSYMNDTWVYNAIPARWHMLSPAASPSGRVKSSMAAIGNSEKLVLFGGWDGTSILNDTWVYDIGADIWTRRSPPVSPPARDSMTLAGVPNDDKVVLFGGKSGAYLFNDTWVYDLSEDRWQQKSPPDAPAPGYGNTLVSFESSDEFMLFGGQNLANATWVYDLGENRWLRQHPVTSPSARHDYGMARVRGTDKAVLFGGLGTTSGTYYSSTWVFNLTSYAPSGTYTSVPRDMGGPANPLRLRWNASCPNGTSIQFQIRGADSLANLSTMTFVGPNGSYASFYTVSAQESWSGHNGSRWVQYRAFLRSAQPELTPVLQNVSLSFDMLPEAPAPYSPAEGAWVNASAEYSWSFRDNDSPAQGGFQFQMDRNTDFSPAEYDSGPVDTANTTHNPGFGDGNLLWRVRTRDVDGAWGPYSMPRLVRIDSASPDIIIIAPCASILETNEFTLFGTASDPGSGISVVDVQADDGGWQEANGTANWRIDLALTSGAHTVRVRARDNVSNSNQIQLTYTINHPPSVNILSPAEGSFFNTSDNVSFSAAAFDPDGDALNYVWRDGAAPLGTGTLLSVRFTEGPHNVSVTVSDGWGHDVSAFVNISIFGRVPVPRVSIVSPAQGEVLANGTLSVDFTVQNISLGNPGAGPHIHYGLDGSAQTEWNATPIVISGLPGGNHTIRIWLVDASERNFTNPESFAKVDFSVYEQSAPLPDISLAPEGLAISPRNPRAGEAVTFSFRLSNEGGAVCPNFTVRLYVDGDLKGRRGFPQIPPGANLTGRIGWTAAAGNHTVLIIADDPDAIIERNEDNNALNITLKVGAAAPAPGFGSLSPILAVALVCAVVGGYLVLGRRQRRAKSAAQTGGAPKATALMPLKDPFTIEDVFLIYGDGRLIQHTTRRLGHARSGSEIMASMLTAVQVFIKDALSKGEEAVLGSMEYSGRKILLEGDKHLILAVVIGGPEPDGLRSEMVQTIRNIRAEYGTIIPVWDGDMSTLSGTGKFLSTLSGFRSEDITALETRRQEKLPSEVKVYSEVEFFQGFARLKVAVKNEGEMLVADAALDLHFNDEILRLDRIEPAYQMSGKRVLLGNLGPREKKSAAFYLDPQICTESAVDGVLTYRDAKGEFRTAPLKRRMVTVVCPILHTEENINTAMLRRTIVDELDQKDSKLFGIPSNVTTAQAFTLGKRAVEAHDVRFVREFFEKEPYKAEAWYYGRTRGRDAKLVIRVTAREDGRTLEFMVASNSRLVVTGLLAELRADLVRRQKEMAPSAPRMEQVFDGALREKLGTERPLLDKYSEGDETNPK
jgi:hypothetical protein